MCTGREDTGVKAFDKRQGGGRGNWGTDNDQLIGETEALNMSDTANVNDEKFIFSFDKK